MYYMRATSSSSINERGAGIRPSREERFSSSSSSSSRHNSLRRSQTRTGIFIVRDKNNNRKKSHSFRFSTRRCSWRTPAQIFVSIRFSTSATGSDNHSSWRRSFISSSTGSDNHSSRRRSFRRGNGSRSRSGPTFASAAAAMSAAADVARVEKESRDSRALLGPWRTFLNALEITNDLIVPLSSMIALCFNTWRSFALCAMAMKTVLAIAIETDLCTLVVNAFFPDARELYKGKTVLITGASQGLGEAIAIEVAKLQPKKIVLASRNRANLEDVRKKCSVGGGASHKATTIEIVEYDAMVVHDFEKEKTFDNGDYDYVFLCAGASQSASAFDVTAKAEKELFQLNVLAPIEVLKIIMPKMIERNQGRVCVISSMAAICPAPGQSSYASTKAALAKYCDSLRAEIGFTAPNVSITNVFPGPIATGFNGKKRVVFNAKGVNQNHPDGVPHGRLTVEHVAKTCLKTTAYAKYNVSIAPKLVIVLSRLVSFVPALAYAAMFKFGPKRAKAAKAGQSLYELKVK